MKCGDFKEVGAQVVWSGVGFPTTVVGTQHVKFGKNIIFLDETLAMLSSLQGSPKQSQKSLHFCLQLKRKILRYRARHSRSDILSIAERDVIIESTPRHATNCITPLVVLLGWECMGITVGIG